MNILMMTNTYKPIVGGLEKSVEIFSKEYRKKGHRVIIVAPNQEGAAEEKDVIRIPAIQHVKNSNFSVHLPIPGMLPDKLADFTPDIVHSHHPYLVGDTALRLAYRFNVPLVFTYHTMYEQNTHYLSDAEGLKRFVVELAAGYSNLADHVFAPSESVMKLIQERGVTTPITVLPTGIDVERFSQGDGEKARKELGIPADAFVVGHIGRLALEKNLSFLAQAVAMYLKRRPKAHLLVVGDGPSEEEMQAIFIKEGVDSRAHLAGRLTGKKLIDAYHAVDVFAFASQSETQGLVLAEAMAAGVPVVGVDAPGVREVVRDQVNGRLILSESLSDFSMAFEWFDELKKTDREKIREACRLTALEFSQDKSVARALEVYSSLRREGFTRRSIPGESAWKQTGRVLKAHWCITKNLAKAAGAVLASEPAKKKRRKPKS